MRPSAMAREERQAAAGDQVAHSAVMNTVLPERASPVTPRRTVGVIEADQQLARVLEASAVASVRSESRTRNASASPHVGRAKKGAAARPERRLTYSGSPTKVVGKQPLRPTPISVQILSASALLGSGPATRR